MKLSPLNSTAISVTWKPPSNKDRHGLIRGYQIHVQEVNKAGDMVGEPVRYDVADENAEAFNVTDLQPDTEYSIQVRNHVPGSGASPQHFRDILREIFPESS